MVAACKTTSYLLKSSYLSKVANMGDMTRKGAVAYLTKLGCSISYKTLQRMERQRNGPSFTRILHRPIVRYRRDDLDAWAAKNMERTG